MATLRKHWFRVSDSVQYEPWSNDVAATFLRLSAHLNTRWAREGKKGSEAGSVVLAPAVCMTLTGCASLVRARRILDELAANVSITVHAQGVNTSIEWPKFSVFQRYESEPGEEPETDATPVVPPPQDARRKTQDAKSRTPAAPAEWALEAAESLKATVARRCPGAPVPASLTAWARELERIKAAKHEVEAAMAWYASKARDAQPYLPECRCGRTFRLKYDKVLAARKRGGVTGTSEASGKPRRYFEAQPRVGGIENPGAAIGNLLRDAGVRS